MCVIAMASSRQDVKSEVRHLHNQTHAGLKSCRQYDDIVNLAALIGNDEAWEGKVLQLR